MWVFIVTIVIKVFVVKRLHASYLQYSVGHYQTRLTIIQLLQAMYVVAVVQSFVIEQISNKPSVIRYPCCR